MRSDARRREARINTASARPLDLASLNPQVGDEPKCADQKGGSTNQSARRVPPAFRSKVTLIFGRCTRAANDPLEEQAVGHL